MKLVLSIIYETDLEAPTSDKFYKSEETQPS